MPPLKPGYMMIMDFVLKQDQEPEKLPECQFRETNRAGAALPFGMLLAGGELRIIVMSRLPKFCHNIHFPSPASKKNELSKSIVKKGAGSQ